MYKRQRGIRANSIAPGFIESDMTAVLSEEVRKEWAKQIPLRRGGKPCLLYTSVVDAHLSGDALLRRKRSCRKEIHLLCCG